MPLARSIRSAPRGTPEMRVLHLGKYFAPFSGGLENLHGDLCAALERLGVETLSLVHDHSGGILPTRSEVPRGPVALSVVRARTFGSLLFAPVSPGVPIHLRRSIRDYRPDVIHVHMPNVSAFWLLLLPGASRIPWVVHWHADVVASRIDTRLRWAYRVYRPFEQALLRRAARIIVTSPPYLESSEPLAPWRSKCQIIPPGLDLRRMPPPKPEAVRAAGALWGDCCYRVLTVGRLTYYKGHKTLLAAAARLPGVRFILVGRGELAGELGAEVCRLGLQSAVSLVGEQSDDMLWALLDSCSCLCLPSVERTEAFGMVLLEAMRYGKPAVVTDVPGSGMSWVVQHGKTGLVARAGDPASIGDALAAVLYDQRQRKELGRAARERLDTVFSIDAQAEAVAAVYAALQPSIVRSGAAAGP